mmetsp:Transcript_14236/g.17244  ORF Transcript_14236/g.17244 Transcript_14236/m.17244 type:complete len:188 (-) Transcript_14236:139-702(-)|eukprot:CAMPEP_0197865854 /NCGR_PEP_ID=MMETSP1438-20131217/43897_1 /TAXON_ID=1461541 /ORGANISM="Pterosperma sp., Strain CCMP1384" /LENGTH=187 /DNA_ID=CAMNT_0043484371 /DNA_START=132 /DNA_END=695 /DNA_ORIENTATION=+
MSLNPTLARHPANNMPIPAAFDNEIILLHRDGIDLEVDLTPGGQKWSGRGVIFVTNIRLVFIAKKPTAQLTAFDIPLVYIRGEKFNQPIFGCNNLQLDCFSVPAGGPGGSAPPHSIRAYFKEGGCGTFLPAFFNVLEMGRNSQYEDREVHTHQWSQPTFNADIARDFMQKAFVDPSDPSTIYVPANR